MTKVVRERACQVLGPSAGPGVCYKEHMRTIGVRELRQQASRYLRDVERGATIEVTDHGRPVARIVPLRPSTSADELVAAGAVVPSRGDPLKLGVPLDPVDGGPLPSEELAALRRAER